MKNDSENIVLNKSYAFAENIVYAYKKLQDSSREFILSKQLLRSGTSIGANVEEASGAQTKKDFISKMSIAYKETRETRYWLRLLTKTGFLEAAISDKLLIDVDELLRLIGTIIKRTKINLAEENAS